MTYYKVVRRRNKKLYSSVAGCNYGSNDFYKRYKPVRYIKNKWVTSKDLNHPKLWVTNDLADAYHILLWDIQRYGNSEGSIYECEIQNAELHNYPMTSSSSYLVDSVKIIKRIKVLGQ